MKNNIPKSKFKKNSKVDQNEMEMKKNTNKKWKISSPGPMVKKN